ncbi:5-formyltetrahydrofolate cyclo-ligase [Amycolatopsis nivea]
MSPDGETVLLHLESVGALNKAIDVLAAKAMFDLRREVQRSARYNRGMQIDEAKRAARERVWSALDAEAVDPRGAAGRIPSFAGAAAAAERLAALDLWRDARVVKSNPDRAQLAVRETALRDGKILYMAVPAMGNPAPFYALDPERVGLEAAQSKYAAGVAPTVGPGQMKPIDVVVCGTVAVDRRGVRVGKGGRLLGHRGCPPVRGRSDRLADDDHHHRA